MTSSTEPVEGYDDDIAATADDAPAVDLGAAAIPPGFGTGVGGFSPREDFDDRGDVPVALDLDDSGDAGDEAGEPTG